MRLFVGIKASSQLQRQIRQWQSEHQALPVRFIKTENLHMTLLPPWYETDPAGIISKLNDLAFSGFPIVFDKIAVNFKNNVIWIESLKPPGELLSLRNELLIRFGKNNDVRPLRIHMTLARFKDLSRFENTDFKSINWREKVDCITLFESKLTPTEARYRSVFVVKLESNI
ncbi:hypothetical protein A2154_02800 [Candidatus Gottesmanbacteria bacterium RBG_16_43_7]|uniref:RNA 2',3'-cyclic phosphodiesterase n=1 Tax=Candidatus Gottesmanbacteria bacterium RBG_16_43_7 TaxID=1798373 RepID=A0A1F5ZA29_9BACT|nr:MAG: hypothetical protein A2154_02800 [Candidatus Gottesmanbacteria bacterium RBG_16_43_7]